MYKVDIYKLIKNIFMALKILRSAASRTFIFFIMMAINFICEALFKVTK